MEELQKVNIKNRKNYAEKLRKYCKKHKIKHDPHIPESDCAATFEVYKNLLSEHGEGFLSQYVVKK